MSVFVFFPNSGVIRPAAENEERQIFREIRFTCRPSLDQTRVRTRQRIPFKPESQVRWCTVSSPPERSLRRPLPRARPYPYAYSVLLSPAYRFSGIWFSFLFSDSDGIRATQTLALIVPPIIGKSHIWRGFSLVGKRSIISRV